MQKAEDRCITVPAFLSNKKRKIKDKSKKIKVFKKGKVCPLITRMKTNEYFALNLILRRKIKLTASASVLLVPISVIRG
jgi:hypothetical protein